MKIKMKTNCSALSGIYEANREYDVLDEIADDFIRARFAEQFVADEPKQEKKPAEKKDAKEKPVEQKKADEKASEAKPAKGK